MSDAWMPSLHLKLSKQEFDQLPRHPAYKYEYLSEMASLSPWPQYHHAQLDLRRFQTEPDRPTAMPIRLAHFDDLEALIPLFVSAFSHLQPFGSLSDELMRSAAEQCLRQTYSGGDGPLASTASFVALENQRTVGAIFITLLPGGDGSAWGSYHWHNVPPAELWENRMGQPHLTWIFVDRFAQGTGIGTQLLRQAASVLSQQGYSSLWTTFLLGNDSSMLWHWRNGFELMPHVRSKRRGGKYT